MAVTPSNPPILIQSRLQQVVREDGESLYDLGICYQTGTAGAPVDLIEAHKWFNLAATAGFGAAPSARAEVAEELTRPQIAAAQAAARAWLGSVVQRRAA